MAPRLRLADTRRQARKLRQRSEQRRLRQAVGWRSGVAGLRLFLRHGLPELRPVLLYRERPVSGQAERGVRGRRYEAGSEPGVWTDRQPQGSSAGGVEAGGRVAGTDAARGGVHRATARQGEAVLFVFREYGSAHAGRAVEGVSGQDAGGSVWGFRASGGSFAGTITGGARPGEARRQHTRDFHQRQRSRDSCVRTGAAVPALFDGLVARSEAGFVGRRPSRAVCRALACADQGGFIEFRGDLPDGPDVHTRSVDGLPAAC